MAGWQRACTHGVPAIESSCARVVATQPVAGVRVQITTRTDTGLRAFRLLCMCAGHNIPLKNQAGLQQPLTLRPHPVHAVLPQLPGAEPRGGLASSLPLRLASAGRRPTSSAPGAARPTAPPRPTACRRRAGGASSIAAFRRPGGASIAASWSAAVRRAAAVRRGPPRPRVARRAYRTLD